MAFGVIGTLKDKNKRPLHIAKISLAKYSIIYANSLVITV